MYKLLAMAATPIVSAVGHFASYIGYRNIAGAVAAAVVTSMVAHPTIVMYSAILYGPGGIPAFGACVALETAAALVLVAPRAAIIARAVGGAALHAATVSTRTAVTVCVCVATLRARSNALTTLCRPAYAQAT